MLREVMLPYLAELGERCLTFALDTHQDFGIWGGRDEEERRLLHRKRRAGHAQAVSRPDQ
jgi:hypothetical protein